MSHDMPSPISTVSIPATDPAEPPYVAVGMSLGYLGSTPAVSSDEPAFWVRRGAALVALSPLSYKLWTALTMPRTIEALATQLARPAVELAEEVAVLQQEQLVVALPQDAQAFLDWHTIRPLAQGVGTGLDPEAPEWCEVWQETRRALRLSLPGYLFWAYSDGLRSLPAVIDAVAAHLELSVPAVLQTLDLPTLLDALLQSGALRLDVDGTD